MTDRNHRVNEALKRARWEAMGLAGAASVALTVSIPTTALADVSAANTTAAPAHTARQLDSVIPKLSANLLGRLEREIMLQSPESGADPASTDTAQWNNCWRSGWRNC